VPKILSETVTDRPETSSRHTSATVRDTATKFQPDVRCVTVFLPTDFVSIAATVYFGEIFTGFRDFVKAINSKTNPLRLRLLPDQHVARLRAYQVYVLSECIRKSRDFPNFRPPCMVIPGVGMVRPNHDPSIVLDEGVVATKFGDASSEG
jgi:hypothetical protein